MTHKQKKNIKNLRHDAIMLQIAFYGTLILSACMNNQYISYAFVAIAMYRGWQLKKLENKYDSKL